MRAYKNYLLIVLTVILVFNYVDRVALGLVLQNIKSDLHLSDTQLGFLSGIAFALFYSVLGVPIARWADRGNRVTIIALTTLLWSVAVGLCATAGTFSQLLLIRIGVAVGEAGCIPPAFSLMADFFSRSERPRAAAIYGMGAPLSAVVGFFVAGWLNQFYGWRVTFIWLGVPGVVLAALAYFTLTEPRYSQRSSSAESPTAPPLAPRPTLKEVRLTLWRNTTFRHLLSCLSVMFFFNYGILQWQPTFFVRSYGLTTDAIGTGFALVYGLGGLAGSYLGGAWASGRAAGDEPLQLRVLAIAVMSSGVLSIFAYLSPNPHWAFGLIGLWVLGLATANGPLLAIIQSLVPESMRAVTFALVYMFANFIGMGLGPLAAGALSDALRPWVGEESLRYALMVLAPGYFLCAWYAWRASKTVARDLAAAPVEHDASAVGQPNLTTELGGFASRS